MASFLRKWFGGRPTPPPHLAAALAELETLARDRPSLQTPCTVLGDILLELFTEPVAESIPSLTTAAAHAKLADGTPLLRGIPLALDEKSFLRRWSAVCDALKQPEAVALKTSALNPIMLLNEALAGRPEGVAVQAEALGLDPTLTGTMLRLCALPALSKIAAGLAALRQGISWDYGFCPACGSWPLLGETRGLEQQRFLRCGLCASAWEVSRFRCVYCGNEDHRSLGYFHVEGEENRQQAATCDVCHGYLKVISTLGAFNEPRLLVTDLATLYLDLTAADRGFFIPAQNEDLSGAR